MYRSISRSSNSVTLYIRIDSGEYKVDMTIDADWNLLWPEIMTGTPRGPSFVVANDPGHVATFGVGVVLDSFVAALKKTEDSQ